MKPSKPSKQSIEALEDGRGSRGRPHRPHTESELEVADSSAPLSPPAVWAAALGIAVCGFAAASLATNQFGAALD